MEQDGSEGTDERPRTFGGEDDAGDDEGGGVGTEVAPEERHGVEEEVRTAAALERLLRHCHNEEHQGQQAEAQQLQPPLAQQREEQHRAEVALCGRGGGLCVIHVCIE
jgi:hypothetical protein